MSFSAMDLLLWVRGPGFAIALAIFSFGVVVRLIELFSLGRKRDLSTPRTPRTGSGWRTILTRSIPVPQLFRSGAVTYVSGYVFHTGFFVALLFLAPHIELFRSVVGFGWPSLPTPFIDAVTVLTLIALLVTLVNRIADPVKRFLSTAGDYLAWAVTFLPLATGYLAYHHALLPYTTMLALHILSAELLLVVLPFSKLMHFLTLFVSRWYNGEAFARRGVAS